ncbi:spore germination lipoprotein GerD [Alkalihalobacillus oceani]|uniref:spore germination lipoprotein GerD n=1 Tax=Halalkalibacter oceani TaxID=1653776 RepID=UPI00203F83B2|nr:spore germination lipoprotein GerD [Halalkalibacter oceani]MCM3762339.1 spore germination lipoprotein GerD [Halalkalibacter oceani]
MKRIMYVLLGCLLLPLVLTSCAAAENGGNSSPDYENTKKMMVDMLKTDEGKAAIQELLQDEELRQELVMDNAFVKQAIQETLTSEAGKKFWQETMKDPEFAKTFAESMQTENEKMLKALMKDPEYQAMMMTILQDPEMERAVLETLKSKEYRQQVMNIMSESFESPYFTAKVNEILSKVAEQQMEKQDQGGNQQNEQQGGGSGGGQESGGGGASGEENS